MDVTDPQYKTKDGSALRMWRDTAQNKFLSEREGRAIFDEVIYVEVISPGSRDSSPVFELTRHFAPEMAHPDDLHGTKYVEYKEYIDDFEKNEDGDGSLAGTPLSQWSEMPRTMVSSMKAQNIFTVDAMAELPDSRLSAVGPDGRTWREKAKAYIANAKDTGYATKLAADLQVAVAANADLQEQVKQLAGQVAVLQASSATGQAAPGTPPADLTPPAPPAPAPAPPAPAPAPATTAGKPAPII